MAKASARTDQRPESEATKRERFIAKVEEGLADVKAGRVYTHAEVLAEMRELFPGPDEPSQVVSTPR
jgi:predicted transcriptional regulator